MLVATRHAAEQMSSGPRASCASNGKRTSCVTGSSKVPAATSSKTAWTSPAPAGDSPAPKPSSSYARSKPTATSTPTGATTSPRSDTTSTKLVTSNTPSRVPRDQPHPGHSKRAAPCDCSGACSRGRSWLTPRACQSSGTTVILVGATPPEMRELRAIAGSRRLGRDVRGVAEAGLDETPLLLSRGPAAGARHGAAPPVAQKQEPGSALPQSPGKAGVGRPLVRTSVARPSRWRDPRALARLLS
jgi:hypothetical protein